MAGRTPVGRARDSRSRRGGVVGTLSDVPHGTSWDSKGDWNLFARVARAARRSIGRDPVTRGVHSLLQLEAHHGIRATWFVICAQPTLRSMLAGDSTYRPDGPPTRRILTALTHAGHEVGLHGSFATASDAKSMMRQRRTLSSYR